MLKALSPITTLIIAWCAAFAEPSASKLVNVVIIALGVLLSSLGEVRFAWTGFIFQMIGTVAESARLVLIQWLLTANQADTQQQPQRATAADEDSCLASSSSSSSNSSISDHEFDAGDVGVASGHSDGDDWSNLPTHGRGAAQISRDDEGNIAVMSPLALLYYYSPVCALLNGLTALMFEAPDFDWNDLNRVGVGMLALNGGVAFLLNLTSVLLIGKTSALTMNLAGILKSLLLVGASAFIWATPITLLQGIGYAISLAGMFYYALPDDSERPHVVLMECLLRRAGRSQGGWSEIWVRCVKDPLRELSGYRPIPEDQDIDLEGSVLLDEMDKEE
ncbi:hypothetical protein UCDDA912_g07128 [Diaporthe ampelina]|uniref:Sugar phosphate transporter domain-containing protein n=1 Tax=Diaporthe ampelina TaxID=1214573 RepID=A0A0G2HYA8_9PEZI|nr:hypothetical protein UCDDA912_g07128 [Diaporthe ampelina]